MKTSTETDTTLMENNVNLLRYSCNVPQSSCFGS